MNGVVLVILDGFGQAPSWGGNAIAMAHKPNLDGLARVSFRTQLQASGQAVGLSGHEMGNSEVGHLNLGAGRIPKLDSTMIFDAIADRSFFTNETILAAIHYARNHQGVVHVMGLVSDGAVHGHIDHLFAVLELVSRQGYKKLAVHGFCDGRDTPPTSAIVYFSRLQDKLKSLGFGVIVSVTGRFFAMDRDRHWDRTKQVVDALVNGVGVRASSALQVIASAYRQGITDEFIPPSVVYADGEPLASIKPGDAVIFTNFRQDRARQLSHMIVEAVPNIFFVGFIPYGFEREIPFGLHSAFAPKLITQSLAEVIATAGYKQFHIAETEKYAHVTYFFNGGRELPFPGEERVLIPSSSVVSFDKEPQMQAKTITKHLIRAVRSGSYRLLVANYANLDMVGHTGSFNATVKAIEIIDDQISALSAVCRDSGYVLMLTGDHGNAEEMIDPVTSEINTEHSRSPVPLIIANTGVDPHPIASGILADVAPTILKLLSMAIPTQMTGKPLI